MYAPRVKRWTRLAAAAALASAALGCGNKDADRFLGALERADYAAAHAELHPAARGDVATPEALKARVEGAGVRFVGHGWTCGSSGDGVARAGYNVTTTKTGPRGPLVIGRDPRHRGKCNGPLVVDLARDDAAPGRPWRVVGMRLD